MEATRATQRPWVAHGAAIAFEAKDCEYRLATMETVPELERIANAALIVKAVNCHDKLVAALRLCLPAVDMAARVQDIGEWNRDKAMWHNVACNARDALEDVGIES